MSDTCVDDEPIIENASIDREIVTARTEHLVDESAQVLLDKQMEAVRINEIETCVDDAVTEYKNETIHNGNLYENNGDIAVEGNEIEISTNCDDLNIMENISANEEVLTSTDNEVMTRDVADDANANEAVYSVTDQVSVNGNEIVTTSEYVIATSENDVSNEVEDTLSENVSVPVDQAIICNVQNVTVDGNEVSTYEVVTETNDLVSLPDKNLTSFNISHDQECAIDDVSNENAVISEHIEINSCQTTVNNEDIMELNQPGELPIPEPTKMHFIQEELPGNFEKEITSTDEVPVLTRTTNHDEETTSTVEKITSANDDGILAPAMITNHDEEMTITIEKVTHDNDDGILVPTVITNHDEETTATVEKIISGNDGIVVPTVITNHLEEMIAAVEKITYSGNGNNNEIVIPTVIIDHDEETVTPVEKITSGNDTEILASAVISNHDEETTVLIEKSTFGNNEENAGLDDITSKNESLVVQSSATVNDPSVGETVEQIETELNKSYELSTNDNTVTNESENKTVANQSVPKVSKRPTHVPPHLMGRDIANPTQDMIGTGRRVQKPRLGVKVPYRNLTSQIVSQDEIAQEIFERTRRTYKHYKSVKNNDILSSLKRPQRISTEINVEKVIKKKSKPKKSTRIESSPSCVPVRVSTENTSNIDSKVEKLHAEISEIPAEDRPVTEAVVKTDPVVRAADSSTSLDSTTVEKIENDDSVTSEASLDHDTLLAILEDKSETCETTTSDVPITTASKTTSVKPSSGPTFVSAQRQKRVRAPFHPSVEKELALKQLMDFEKTLKRGRKPKILQTAQKSPENGVVSGPNSAIVITGANELPEKRLKRGTIHNSAPKSSPSKYQRIMKRQLRNSKIKTETNSKIKTETNCVPPIIQEPAPQPPKKLPEVPEVDIAIDRYIKTYASKRKRHSNDKSTEKPPEKKTRDHVPLIDATSAKESSKATHMDVDDVPESIPIVSKSPAASTSIVRTRKSPAKSAPKVTATSTPKPTAITKKQSPVASTSKTTTPTSSKTTPVVATTQVNSRMMREINRLLGDEGAINMIYSVEQKRSAANKSGVNVIPPSRNRITKDLESKTKMVKNAVLRLSMSSSPESVRRRRISPETSITDGEGSGSVIATATSPLKAKPAPQPTPVVETKSSDVPVTKTKVKESAPSLSIQQRRQVAAEASRIIRRHSSSSSSGDEEPNSVVPVIDPGRPSSSTAETNRNEPAAKEKKDTKAKTPKSRRESKDSAARSSHTSTATTAITDNSYEILHQSSYKEISLRIYDHLVHIVLASTTLRMKNAINIQMLYELIDVLDKLEKEVKCKVVLITSTGSIFCQGVDLQTVICTNQTERVEIVNKYVDTLTNFTKRLSEFPKTLIAGVHGLASGLGVTMLPFFDMVLASEKATFKTPYVRLGQVPEAGATATLPSLLGIAIAKELFFACRTLTADEALQFGLIVRTLPSNKFDEELLSLAKSMADHSSQSTTMTKMLLRRGTNSKLDEQLELEAKLLKEQWCSEECQKRFEEYLQQETVTLDN